MEQRGFGVGGFGVGFITDKWTNSKDGYSARRKVILTQQTVLRILSTSPVASPSTLNAWCVPFPPRCDPWSPGVGSSVPSKKSEV